MGRPSANRRLIASPQSQLATLQNPPLFQPEGRPGFRARARGSRAALTRQQLDRIMSKRHKVIATDFITDTFAPERSVLGDIADVVALKANDEKELVGKVEDAGALMVYHSIFRLSGATIDRLSGCKVITRCGVGYDNVELLNVAASRYVTCPTTARRRSPTRRSG
jgi:D-isomer specific 2-hydroxyacid dehydrogenase, catalytic domain